MHEFLATQCEGMADFVFDGERKGAGTKFKYLTS
jgi:hypothetical protein